MARASMVIDFHTHTAVPGIREYLRKNLNEHEIESLEWGLPKDPALREVERSAPTHPNARTQLSTPQNHLAHMDAHGIDMHVISVNYPVQCYGLNAECGRTVARICNEGVAEFVAKVPDRFVGIGVIPMQDEASALAELDYAIGTLGLKGIGVTSHVAGRELGEHDFWGVWKRVCELDIPVFIHPQGFTHPQRFEKFGSFNTVGQPLEETLCMLSLIHEGVLETFPDIKFCVAHGGGYLPYYSGRSDMQYAVRPAMHSVIPHKPSYYIEKFYCDSVTGDQRMLEYLIDKIGADHVLNGSDYPWVMWDSPGTVKSMKIADEAKQQILWKNAARLLKL
jgi:aminocarboxymuconate-semialdehyde decarboxylase